METVLVTIDFHMKNNKKKLSHAGLEQHEKK